MPTDEQLAELRDSLPSGEIIDSTRYGENVDAMGQAARIIGLDAGGQIYCGYLDPVMGDPAYGAFAADQITSV